MESTTATPARFLQIHTLHSYPGTLLNRDDSGLAKRMQFGEDVRTRISSQCLKRHWRTAQDEFALSALAGVPGAIRSRNIVDKKVMPAVKQVDGVQPDVISVVQSAFNVGVYGKGGDQRGSRQPLLLGLPEVEHLQQRAAAICKEHPADAKAAAEAATALFTRKGEGNNFKAMLEAARLPAGIEGALFGRMVTSDPGANIDAAIHVAHAFTVHAEESESDYFTVVDDLKGDDDDAGADHIGEMELTAGLFYGYVVVDIPGLVSNLEGCPAEEWTAADRGLAGNVVRNLVHLIATVSPGAKLGSTAPYAYADLMLVEAGSRQPRTMANAFRDAAQPHVKDASKALGKYIASIDECYGQNETRRMTATRSCVDIPTAERIRLDDLADWAAGVVTG